MSRLWRPLIDNTIARPRMYTALLGTFAAAGLLLALIGIYVGVIPVAIGMLWLPWIRGVDRRWIGFLLAFTVGLLAFLGVEERGQTDRMPVLHQRQMQPAVGGTAACKPARRATNDAVSASSSRPTLLLRCRRSRKEGWGKVHIELRGSGSR